MRKPWWIVPMLLLFPTWAAAQLVVESFDEAPTDPNYWIHVINQHADTSKGYVHVSYVTDPVKVGTGAMRLDYSVHNMESWGGFSKIEHWHPDSTKTYDFSMYDTLTIWYYNIAPASKPGRVHLRIQFYDVSDAATGANTYNANQGELWYSFHYVLDNAPGWHQIRMLMVDARMDPKLDEWGGEGFNLTGWAGIWGNNKLDLDRIKGFGFEFSVSGGGEGDHVFGTIVLDHMELRGLKRVAYIFFNGKTLSTRLSQFTWGQSTLELVEGAGTNETNALKWTQGNEWGNGWTGAGWNINPPFDMSAVWETDTLKFRMKTDPGVGALRVQLEDGQAKVGKVFQPIDDEQWHDYAFKLSELEYQDGTSNFNPSNVKVLQFMANGTGVAGKVVWIDFIWTDSPVIDVIPPAAPTGVGAMAAEYYNLVFWQDVPGESGEKYTVYASTKPITDLNDPDVDLVAANVPEDTRSAVHWLYYPLKDKEVQYYYAVTCTDEAGNVSKSFGATSVPTTNVAKGIPTISLNPPANFAADGDLSEWDQSGIRPFVLKPETDYVVVGSINDSSDLKATVYLAIDDNYLYVAGDIVDDVYHFGPGNWWEQDAFQFFIGMYDLRGAKHASYKRGDQPDYSLIFVQGELFAEGTHYVLGTPGDGRYFFTDLGGADYVFEAKISLDTLAISYNANDRRFHPQRGMRIPLELYFHDNDGKGWEGNLGRSPYNTDHGWQDPREWEYTWIGDTTHVSAVSDVGKGVPTSFSLSQNYPNPFNPATTVTYSVAKPGVVKIELYNALGQKVKTLVNEFKQAGEYTVQVNASDLPSGVYFYRMQAGDFTATKKMVLIR